MDSTSALLRSLFSGLRDCTTSGREFMVCNVLPMDNIRYSMELHYEALFNYWMMHLI